MTCVARCAQIETSRDRLKRTWRTTSTIGCGTRSFTFPIRAWRLPTTHLLSLFGPYIVVTVQLFSTATRMQAHCRWQASRPGVKLRVLGVHTCRGRHAAA